MKANDLRLKNLVWFNGRIYLIQPHDIGFLNENPDYKSYEPIPLNEQWLRKFGFKSVGNYLESKFENKHMEITYYKNKIELTAGKFTECPTILNHIEYVHQLQNLFYALSDEELTM